MYTSKEEDTYDVLNNARKFEASLREYDCLQSSIEALLAESRT